jgi:pectate lyase
VSISGFTVYNFGKLYRSCGNCDEMYERHVTIEGVTAVEGSSTLVGINSNYGDTATIKSDTCVEGVETVCAEYEGNDTGDEVSFPSLRMLDCLGLCLTDWMCVTARED